MRLATRALALATCASLAAGAQTPPAPPAPLVAEAASHVPTTPPAAAATADSTPLLTYTDTQRLPPSETKESIDLVQNRLLQIQSQIKKDPPPESDCAQTLGAKRFAALYDDLGSSYSNLGEDEKAIDAFNKALDCSPRATFVRAEVANSLLNLGRFDEARAAIQHELATGRPNFSVHSLATQLDFIAERWQEASDNARLSVKEAQDEMQASYWQCFLWLAQKRMGTQVPELVHRELSDNWPRPVLELLQGKIGESDLVADVKSESDGHRRREILVEALFYTGELRLANHQPDEAKAYFTAAIKLDVPYFIEHHMAAAELDKLRRRMQPSP